MLHDEHTVAECKRRRDSLGIEEILLQLSCFVPLVALRFMPLLFVSILNEASVMKLSASQNP